MADKPGRYEVLWSVWHHGQHVSERPWCLIFRSPPGTPGEPHDGIRYLSSYETRERAIYECAKSRAAMSKVLQRGRFKLDALTKSVIEQEAAKLEEEVETR